MTVLCKKQILHCTVIGFTITLIPGRRLPNCAYQNIVNHFGGVNFKIIVRYYFLVVTT